MLSIRSAISTALLVSAGAVHAQPMLPDPDELFINPQGKQGCWASFFGSTDFRAPAVQFTGRTYIESFEPQAVAEPELQQAGGAPFLKRARSLALGPHARLVGYTGEWFDKPSLELEPGRRIGDLSAIDFHARVQSFKVLCVAEGK